MTRLEYFKLFHDIDAADYQLLIENLKTRNFRKGDFIIVPGQIQREIFFVKSGVQMSYFEAGEKTHVIAFTYFPNLCAIPQSFSFQKPSSYFLTCLTDSEMEFLTFDQLQVLFDRSQPIERLFRRMTEAVLSGVLERQIEQQSLTMKEKYKAFCQRSPHLLQLVPHKYIASYLGIDATNFSKLYNNVKI